MKLGLRCVPAAVCPAKKRNKVRILRIKSSGRSLACSIKCYLTTLYTLSGPTRNFKFLEIYPWKTPQVTRLAPQKPENNGCWPTNGLLAVDHSQFFCCSSSIASKPSQEVMSKREDGTKGGSSFWSDYLIASYPRALLGNYRKEH